VKPFQSFLKPAKAPASFIEHRNSEKSQRKIFKDKVFIFRRIVQWWNTTFSAEGVKVWLNKYTFQMDYSWNRLFILVK